MGESRGQEALLDTGSSFMYMPKKEFAQFFKGVLDSGIECDVQEGAHTNRFCNCKGADDPRLPVLEMNIGWGEEK